MILKNTKSINELTKRFFSRPISSFLIDDTEVQVNAEYDAADPSVGIFSDGITICSVWIDGEEVTESVSADNLSFLESQIREKYQGYCEAYMDRDS